MIPLFDPRFITLLKIYATKFKILKYMLVFEMSHPTSQYHIINDISVKTTRANCNETINSEV